MKFSYLKKKITNIKIHIKYRILSRKFHNNIVRFMVETGQCVYFHLR